MRKLSKPPLNFAPTPPNKKEALTDSLHELTQIPKSLNT